MRWRIRIRRLEHRLLRPGVCPACGFRPGDIVLTEVRFPFGWEPRPQPPDPPPTCSECGGWLPPAPTIEVVADAPRSPGTPPDEVVPAPQGEGSWEKPWTTSEPRRPRAE